jgi:hypothetical protein
MEYQDFELELSTQANGAHRVSVIASPAGEARQPITLGLEDTALRAQLAQIEQTLRYRANATAEQKRANLAAVKRFGGGLFDALLNDNLKSLYDQSRLITQQRSQGLRLKLRVQSPLLAALPWELLYDAALTPFSAPRASSRLCAMWPCPGRCSCWPPGRRSMSWASSPHPITCPRWR